jgi:hypothetical protein
MIPPPAGSWLRAGSPGCFLWGHDIGNGPQDVRFYRGPTGRLLGFGCRRCGQLIASGPVIWTGAVLELVNAVVWTAATAAAAALAASMTGLLR